MAKLTAAIDTLEANIEELTASNETWEAGISSLHDRMGAADEMIDMSAKLEQGYYYDQTQQATMAEPQTLCQGYVKVKAAGLSSELEQARSESLSMIEELEKQCQDSGLFRTVEDLRT